MNNVSLMAVSRNSKWLRLQNHARFPDSANHFEAPQLQKAPNPLMKLATFATSGI